MNRTTEYMTDPVAFVAADPTLYEHLKPGQHNYIGAADYDVHIYKLRTPGLDLRRDNYPFSPILGDLYSGGAVANQEIAGGKYNLDWYPSQTAANGLLMSLGVTPGVDALRFTLSPDTMRIPTVRYAKHFASGEFPQCDHGEFFGHDRDEDHAVGAILLMPIGARWLISKANQQVPKKFAGLADEATSSNGKIMDLVWPAAQEYAAGHDAELPAISTYYTYHTRLWGVNALPGRRNHTNRKVVATAAEYLAGLVPTLGRLKTEYAASKTETRT